MKHRSPCIVAASAAFLACGAARAASVTIGPGETRTLTADLTLAGADTLDASGTVQSPCTIVGNGHAIVATGLTGHVKIQNCKLQGLGGVMENAPAMNLTTQGSADVTITGTSFDACGSVRLQMNGASTATVNNDLFMDTGIAYIQDELVGSMYVPAFYASGSSTGAKVFQGNDIYRSAAHFDGVSNWLIGGYGDQFTNVVIGHRGVIRVRGNHVKVVGNYINPQYALTSPDVENLVVGSDDANPDLIVEHNVLRSGEWVLRECQGEVRYNLIAEMNGHAWIKGPHDCNVHHNIFVNYATPDPNREAGIDAVYVTPHLNIYNNTFDGGGKLADLGVPAIHACKGCLIERVHSNAITSFTIAKQYCTSNPTCTPSPAAAVSNVDDETQYDTSTGTARMHYADFNLFYNPDADTQLDYSLPVVQPSDDTTSITKGSDGFGKHDVHAAPQLSGPFPQAFPYANADIEARAATAAISTILKHYRDLYTPATGSPLIGAGDPHNGSTDPNPNNNIGAIGQGQDKDPDDKFGTFQPGPPGGPPPLGGVTGAGGGTGAGGRTGAGGAGVGGGSSPDGGAGAGGKGGSSGGCSCGLDAGGPRASAWGLALLAAAIAGASARRRARARCQQRG